MRRRIFLALAPLALSSVALTACVINIPPLFGGGRGPVAMEEIVPAKRFFTTDQILIVDLTGVVSIQGATGWLGIGGPGMLVELKDRLDEAEKNKRIKAVVLRIDSPGGGVTASDLIHHEILEFKKRRKIPVVAMMQDVAASGGLYIAMAADEVYALPSTLTGSIGVITMLPGLEKLSEKIGFEMRVIKSGDNKDLGSPWRSLDEDERELFQQMVDTMYERFLDVIVAARGPKGLGREELRAFADGRVLDGASAARLGLIDGVAYFDEVIERAKHLAGIDDAAIVSYEYPYSYRGNIYASTLGAGGRPRLGAIGELNFFKVDLGFGDRLRSDALFLYMWLP